MDQNLAVKIQKAREAGVPDEYIQRRVLQDQSMQKSSAPAPAPEKKGNFLTSKESLLNLPTLGGLGGAAAGAAAGTAFLPGVGTVIGGLLGGLFGGAGGEVVRQKANNEDTSWGDIAKQGVIGGASELGGQALGAGVKLAGRGVAKLAGKEAVDLAGETAAKAATKEGENALTRSGNKLRQSVTNPQVHAGPWGNAEEARLSQIADKELGLKGSAGQKYAQLGTKFEDLSKQIGSHLEQSKAVVSKNDLLSRISSGLEDSFSSVDQDAIATIERNLGNIADKNGNIPIQKLFKYKQSLGNTLKRAFSKLDSPTAVLTAKEETALGAWKQLASSIGEAEPGISKLTGLQSDIFDLAPGLAKARNSKSALTIVGTNIPVPKGITGSARDSAGRLLQGSGEALDKAAPVVNGAKALAKKAPAQLVGQSILNPATGIPEDVNGVNFDQGDSEMQLPDFGATENPSPQPPSGGLTPEFLNFAMQKDILENGGKNVDKLKVLQGTVAAPKQGKLTDTAIKTVNDYQTAISGLTQLTSTIKSNPDDIGYIRGLQANIPGANAQKVQAQIKQVAQIVGKALEGGKLTDADVPKYEKILPSIRDTPDVAQAKIRNVLNMLQSSLSNYVDLQNNRGGGSFNLPESTDQVTF